MSRRIRKWQGSIAVRISVLLIVVVLLPTALIQMYLTRRYEETMDSYVNTYLLNAFESTYSNYEKCFEDMRAQANYLLMSPALKGSIAHAYTGVIDRDIVEDNGAIDLAFNSCKNIYAREATDYTFLIDDGRIFATWGTLRFPASTEWIERTMSSAKTRSGNTWFFLDGREEEGDLSALGAAFAVAKRVSASPFSAIVVSMPAAQMASLCAGVPDLGGNSMVLMLDAENETILSVGEPDEALLDQVRAAAAGAQSGAARIVHRGTAYAIFRSFSANQWKLVQVFDDTAGSFGGGLLRNHLLSVVIALCLVALGSIMILVVFHMTNDIRALDGAVREFSADHRPHLLPERGNDEVAVLTRHFNAMQNNMISLLAQVQKDEKEKMRLHYEAQLSEMNPHFLYNTLNSIRWVAMFSNAQNVADLLESLGVLLKVHTSKVDELIPLEETVQILDHYMNLQYARFGEMIHLNKAIPQEALRCMVPKFCAQPLVENALIHAFEHQRRKGTVTVTARMEEERLLLTVKDDGAGMTAEQLEHLKRRLANPAAENETKSIGLRNIVWRIYYLFGKDYGMDIESEKDVGTTVILRLPIVLQEGEEE